MLSRSSASSAGEQMSRILPPLVANSMISEPMIRKTVDRKNPTARSYPEAFRRQGR
jgi:hypothetical protein